MDKHSGENTPQPQKSTLYDLEFPEPEHRNDDGQGPVLIHALEGFTDAGHAVSLATKHLRDSLESELVATFNTDELMNYRTRRPTMSFSGNTFTDIEMPKLTLSVLRDNDNRSFFLLAGSEPDLRWERFVTAVQALVDHFEISSVIGLNAIPMAVPHTRPSTITAHGSSDSLIGDLPTWGTELKIPASTSMLIELRLQERGYDTLGLTVHVPHYLSQTNYPGATHAILQTLSDRTGLTLPLTALENAAEKVRTQIDGEVVGNSEIEAVVHALEQQYDAFQRAESSKPSLLALDGEIPSGEELGAEFEKFLANLDEDSQ